MGRPVRVTIVLPTYGGNTSVSSVVRDIAVAAFALRARQMHTDVVFVDDGVSGLGQQALAAAAEYGVEASVISGVASPGAAYLQGYRQVLQRGAADLVATLDATGQHDATQLPHLVDQLVRDDLHAIIGSRWARASGTPGLTVGRAILARTANFAFRRVTGVRALTDVTTTFRVVRVELLSQLRLDELPDDLHGVQMAVVAEAVARAYRVGEGPIIYHQPAGGQTKIRLAEVRSFARQVFWLRRYGKLIRRQRLSPDGRQFSHLTFGAAGDLERLGTADRFFDWALEAFEPYLKGSVLEVGAGLGTITRKLVQTRPDLSIVALEPAGNVFPDLASYAAVSDRASAYQLTTAQYLADTQAPMFDAVLYLNVLEHIDDEPGELRLAHQALRPGGVLLVFGPALERLYSELDYNAGHYRRYHLATLRQTVRDAGFEIVSLQYFDVLGVLPYLIVYRWMRRPAISGSTMWGYDRVLVPVSRMIQRLLRNPPLGKNVILVARKLDTEPGPESGPEA